MTNRGALPRAELAAYPNVPLRHRSVVSENH